MDTRGHTLSNSTVYCSAGEKAPARSCFLRFGPSVLPCLENKRQSDGSTEREREGEREMGERWERGRGVAAVLILQVACISSGVADTLVLLAAGLPVHTQTLVRKIIS